MDKLKPKIDTHKNHDLFIKDYLNNQPLRDEVLIALEESLTEGQENKRTLAKFIREERGKTKSRRRYLALLILWSYFPEEWATMYKAAYKLLKQLLEIIHTFQATDMIYPPKWTEKIFRAECLLSPDSLKGIIFGIDPLSDSSNPLREFATGYAFSFDIPKGTNISRSVSAEGLNDAYYLDINLTNVQQFEDSFIKPSGVALVNFIRMIKEDSKAGSENPFLEAWTTYNLNWLKSIKNISKKVLIFQNEDFPFNNYSQSKDFKEINELLKDAPRCCHPSYIKREKNHCLKSPKVVNCKGKGVNQSVDDLQEFFKQVNASKFCKCGCRNFTSVSKKCLKSGTKSIDDLKFEKLAI